jgi:oligopeptide transport system substrate-binding protein
MLREMRSVFSVWTAALALVACAAFASGCERQPDGVVQVIAIGGDPALANPRLGPLDPSEAVLVTNVAQGLVRFDALGQIEPGLAEAWNVSDDGMSYIFRLASGQWPNGREISADHVAGLLRRLIGAQSRNPLRDSFRPVTEIVAMTDRVIEIRLNQPRPHLLQLLAQPEMGLVYEGQGTGPFSIDTANSSDGRIRLVRQVLVPDEEDPGVELLDLSGAKAAAAIDAFAASKADLVLGGTFADLPLAQRAKLPSGTLQFDPASGLFGLVPARAGGLAANLDVRELLSAAIDRDAIVAALAVPSLLGRTTLLEPGLDGIADPIPPEWAAVPIEERRADLAAAAGRLLPSDGDRTVRIQLPEGPGGDILLERLSQDWGALGLTVERAPQGTRADFRLVDQVAPSSSPNWFVRQFRCGFAILCSEEVDTLLQAARITRIPAQEATLLQEAARRIDSEHLYIPIAAPIRWALVSARISGFAGNRYSLHTLAGLEQRLDRTAQ